VCGDDVARQLLHVVLLRPLRGSHRLARHRHLGVRGGVKLIRVGAERGRLGARTGGAVTATPPV
jgi:hypothetical protein